MRALLIFAVLSLGVVAPISAQAFEVVQDRSRFVDLVVGRKLTRLGISLDVTDSGQIQGRAFGKSVSGQWRWENGFFCRTLFHGRRDLGANCQEVRIDGNTLRFTSDRGAGIYADLVLR
jgi:hypothetical protein